MTRASACESTRKRIAELWNQEVQIGDLVREAIRLIVEEALEAEVADRLGREHYERGRAAGYRNGYRRGRLKYADGMVEYSVPQVAGTPTPWRSEVQAALAERAEELTRLALKMYTRGLSVRDIKAAFADRSGRCLLSGTAACYVCKRLGEACNEFANRNLSGYNVRYLFVEDIGRGSRPGQQREGALAAWGITETGSKVLLGLAPASKHLRNLLGDLRARGVSDSALLIPYGPGADTRSLTEVSENAATAVSRT